MPLTEPTFYFFSCAVAVFIPVEGVEAYRRFGERGLMVDTTYNVCNLDVRLTMWAVIDFETEKALPVMLIYTASEDSDIFAFALLALRASSPREYCPSLSVSVSLWPPDRHSSNVTFWLFFLAFLNSFLSSLFLSSSLQLFFHFFSSFSPQKRNHERYYLTWHLVFTLLQERCFLIFTYSGACFTFPLHFARNWLQAV